MLVSAAPLPALSGPLPLLGARLEPVDPGGRPLRVAMLVYRGNPRCGGQGVYVRHLSRALADLGHRVEVFSGPPYPDLDERVRLTPVPSLDLFRASDPWRIPNWREFRTSIDAVEFALMCTAGFPEPLTFSLRVERLLRDRLRDFDVVHDNQGLGYGMLRVVGTGVPVVTTIHHPVVMDRDLEIAHAPSLRKRLTLRRWYGFLGMQSRVARRVGPILTVSESSRRDIVRTMGVDPALISVVPLGVSELFGPRPEVARVRGRVLVTTSADVPLKGLVTLIEAVALLRRRRPDAHLVVVGTPRPNGPVSQAVARHGLGDEAVRFATGISDARLVELYAEAEVAAVPSLYEGFSLPAIEAMACGVPLVATTAGALPEVAGAHGETAWLVPPGDPGRLAAALGDALDDDAGRLRIGSAARARVLERYSWAASAAAHAAAYQGARAGC